ncbi:unnamed protein product [Clonostachys rosea]|uniref:Uncharacterized protein n=1 Tax=Bionectria ochroleuca TaxID=29856 RepID=A0ABY6TXY5_BIOOC|nr:unnamed protein product [Clonostachys rosea]
MSESLPKVEADEEQRQQCLQYAKRMSQQLRELQNPGENHREQGQTPDSDPAQPHGGSTYQRSTDVEFAETVASVLSGRLQHGPVFKIPGSEDVDATRLPGLVPGTSFGYVSRDNIEEEFKKAYLRAARESETGGVYFMMGFTDMEGLPTRVAHASRAPEDEDSNLQKPAEDATGADHDQPKKAET